MRWNLVATWTAAFFMSAALFSNTVALRLLLLAAGLAFAALAVLQERGSIHVLPPVWLAFVAWAAWAWLSLAWSMDPDRTLKDLRNETLYAGLAFWMCYVAGQARESARVVVPVVAASAALLCLVALHAYVQGDLRSDERWHGGPGFLSAVLLTLLPCALAGGWYGHRAGWRHARPVGVVLVLLFLAAAYSTFNRVVWLAAAAQVLVLGALLLVLGRTSFAARTRTVVGAGVMVMAGAAAMGYVVQSAREVYDGGSIILAEDPRLRLWPEIVERISARPITGYGFGRGMLAQPLSQELNDPLLWHAHNLFLDAALQLGLPGLLFLVFMLGATLRAGWRLARSTDDYAAACGAAVVAVVAGMVVRNMTDTLWVRHTALVYWAVLGTLFAWGLRAQQGKKSGIGAPVNRVASASPATTGAHPRKSAPSHPACARRRSSRRNGCARRRRVWRVTPRPRAIARARAAARRNPSAAPLARCLRRARAPRCFPRES